MRKILYPEEYKELIEGSEVNKQEAEKAYKQYVGENVRNFRIRVKFNNGELTSNDIASIRINSDLFTTDTFTIGSVVAETLDLTIFRNYTQVNKKNPIIPFISLRTEVEIKTEIETETGIEIVTEKKEVWQEVCLGVFYINPDGVSEDGINTTSIRASSIFNHPDYGNKEYSFSETGTFSKNLVQIIERMNDGTSIPSFTIKNPEDLPDITITNRDNIVGKTYREVLNYVATLYGGFARIIYDEEKDKRYLEFFKMQKTDYKYDESSYMSFKRSREFLTITKIECKSRKENEEGKEEESTIVAGSGDVNHSVYIECNDMTEERLDAILTEYMKHDTYHPITSKIFGNPVLEVGDIATISGRGIKNEGAAMPLHSITYNITGNGVTMDIKSIFKAREVSKTKSVKNTINEEIKKNNESMKEEITITDEDGKTVPLKDDYLETKDSLNKQYTDLKKELDDHIKNASSDGNISDMDTSIVERLIFTNDEVDMDLENGTGYSSIQGVLTGQDSDECGLQITGEYGIFMSVNNKDGYHNVMHFQDHDSDGKVTATMHADLKVSGDTNFYGNINISNSGQADPYKVMFNNGIEATSDTIWYISKARFKDCSLNTDLNGNGNTIYHVFTTEEMEPESTYTASLIESGTNENLIYGGYNYDLGELRWCWKETVFTYPESDVDPETDEWVYTGRYLCYIELPIFMAENIQNDYHINVSKMSWGDYRIIEKNPYYFILESQEEDFAFTFEVVAKLNDNQTLNNNAIIANIGIGSSTEEPI